MLVASEADAPEDAMETAGPASVTEPEGEMMMAVETTGMEIDDDVVSPALAASPVSVRLAVAGPGGGLTAPLLNL
jgi:hypothetical protein